VRHAAVAEAVSFAAGSCGQGSIAQAFSTAGITVEVYASSAPNYYGSPSWAGYVSNGMYALENGLTSYYDSGDAEPTHYMAFADGATIDAGYAMVSSFNSWLGVADPAAPFDQEHGNRIHFGLHAYGDGQTQFTLADVSYEMVSVEYDNYNTLGVVSNLAGTTFNGTTRIGIDWGTDRIPGTADDIRYDNNEGDAVLVDELFYIGVGNAWWPQGDDQQAAIDDTYAWVRWHEENLAPINFSGTYTILESSGTASVNLIAVPLPTAAWAGMALMGAMGGVAGIKRRLRRA
jgi:hypothetical protein